MDKFALRDVIIIDGDEFKISQNNFNISIHDLALKQGDCYPNVPTALLNDVSPDDPAFIMFTSVIILWNI